MARSFTWVHAAYLVEAARWTVLLSLIAFAGGAAGGLLLALARVQRRSQAANAAAALFIGLFQGTPLLMQLFLCYFGLGVLGFPLDAWTAVAIALTCYASSFLGDIWTGCIGAIPSGQAEAARALSLSASQAMRLVILPQAVRIAVAPTVGFAVQVVKSTSLTSIVGFAELMRAGQVVNNVTLQPMLVYSIVTSIYFALCWPLSLLAGWLERRVDKDAIQEGRTGRGLRTIAATA